MRQAWLAAFLVLACATSASAADPEGARKKFFVGAALFEDGEYGDAIPYLEKAIELDPGFCRVHYYLAKSYHETGSDRARASAEAYKDCATDGEQADADALLALIPASAAASDAAASSGGGGGSSSRYDDDDSGSSRRWEDDEEEEVVARYEDEDRGGRRRWEDDEEDDSRWDRDDEEDDADDEEDAGSSRTDDEEDEDEDTGSSRWDDDEDDDEGSRWDDDERSDDSDEGGRWDEDEDSDDEDEDSDSYDEDDEDDDRGGAYNASANTDSGATYDGPSAGVALKRRRTAGGVMMGVGIGVAAGGFVMSYAMYSKYYWESDTGLYAWSRNVNIAGFAVGVAGAAIAGTGLLLAVLPDSSKRTALIVPGPVTTVTFAF